MTIVIEGCDGTGKTTIANILAKRYGCDVVHMTGDDPKDYEFYYHSLRKTNVIYDRNVIGELVYPYVFGRNAALSYENAESLVKKAKIMSVKFFVLTADEDIIKNRIAARGEEDTRILASLSYIDAKFRSFAYENDIPIIDTTRQCPVDAANKIIKIIEGEQ